MRNGELITSPTPGEIHGNWYTSWLVRGFLKLKRYITRLSFKVTNQPFGNYLCSFSLKHSAKRSLANSDSLSDKIMWMECKSVLRTHRLITHAKVVISTCFCFCAENIQSSEFSENEKQFPRVAPSGFTKGIFNFQPVSLRRWEVVLIIRA